MKSGCTTALHFNGDAIPYGTPYWEAGDGWCIAGCVRFTTHNPFCAIL
jgi:hypothetical protein